jgi:hypothetical protein
MDTELSEKEQMRIIYPFKSNAAYDAFFEGMNCAFSNQTEKSVGWFRTAMQLEPDNPLPYNFLVMSLEFMDESPEDERKTLCEKWVEVAGKSGNTTQMLRSKMALDYYEMTPEERKQRFKNGVV